jgi:CIC family chloride channel protein
MLMVAEMTGSFSVVPGAIIAVGVASLLMSRSQVTIYRAQRLDRTAAEAERAHHEPMSSTGSRGPRRGR